MSSLAWESALSLLGTGTQIWTMRRTLEQERKLHAHEHRTAMEQHFSSMSTELLAIAKEADRDVWEQRQNMFSQLLVCAVLMFGVAFGNINEGTYAYDKVVDKHGFDHTALLTKDGLFVLFTGFAIASLFICIVACLVVMRRMSSYMIIRSSLLVDRLAVSTDVAHQISGTAQRNHHFESGEEVEEALGAEKRRFHAKIGAAIGSGPKQARDRRRLDRWPTSMPKPSGPNGSAVPMLNVASEASEREPINGQGNGGNNGTAAAPSPPESDHGRETPTPPAAMVPASHAPLNFGFFYNEYCALLAATVVASFVVGVLCAWVSVWLLLWNQFPHFYVAMLAFAVIGVLAIATAGRLEWRTRQNDQVMKRLLRTLDAPMHRADSAAAPPPPPPTARPEFGPPPPPGYVPPPMQRAPSPPPSPPLRTRPAPRLPAPHRRTAATRLRELAEAEATGLLKEEEVATKRAEILAAL